MGAVLYGEEWVATVRYHLAATARTGRFATMEGELYHIEGNPLAMLQRNYILCLADGREVAFFVIAMPPTTASEEKYAVGTVGPLVMPAPTELR